MGYSKYTKVNNNSPVNKEIYYFVMDAKDIKAQELFEQYGENPESAGGNRLIVHEEKSGNGLKIKSNPWITHVKSFAKTNKITYKDAMKNEKCKSSYKKL